MSESLTISPGQRWISETEPELGLGIMLKVEFKRVEVMFPAANEQRQYALDSAPLRRVALKTGDVLETHDGDCLEIEEVRENGGLLVYRCGERDVDEAQLSDTMSFSRPEDRLLAGRIDDLRTYDLRVDALQRQCEVMKSPVRGFLGGRVDLIPHQIYIASEVSSRLAPRVLLADEVGLGKTIEACLIMHRLHLTGRADRVLILVPEPLLHQWFVELLRRFNLLFSLFDEERCQSIEQGGEGADNPFLDSQLVLASVDFLANSERRAEQAIAAGWDMLIVDEAHHLEWAEGDVSTAYTVVEQLARKAEALLLLTATPRQLGADGHFARLRLLDPERYTDLQKFQQEAEQYEAVAEAVDRLLAGEPLSREDRALFTEQSERVHDHCLALDGGDESAREPLVRELLDAFGTGRVMFRNTRAALTGFPERKAHLHEVDDDKVAWLISLLKDLGEQKVLMICKTRELVEQIVEKLQQLINLSAAHFHEGMTLLQRDRAAAYFSEEEGARILICSEIGSEGRNFQFAHHMVLFDLPDDPELLEQRIGRLDRIGQTETINIHVPYQVGTQGERLACWYHDGLHAFEHSLHGASEIVRDLGDGLESDDLEMLIEKTKQSRAKVAKKLEKGYDRLLELNSSRPELAADTIAAMESMDKCRSSEEFLLRLWDHFGLHVEELGGRGFLLQAGHLITDAFPALPDEGLNCTFSRERSLSREDSALMTWDHPMARSALELLLTSEAGNATFGVMENAPEKVILLEVFALIECVAPASLHSDRFLPPTPIRVQVDHAGNDRTAQSRITADDLRPGNLHKLLDQDAFRRKILPNMVEQCRKNASGKMQGIIDEALNACECQLGQEIDRITALGEINDHISEDEILALKNQRSALRQAIGNARLRLDSVRLVWCQK